MFSQSEAASEALHCLPGLSEKRHQSHYCFPDREPRGRRYAILSLAFESPLRTLSVSRKTAMSKKLKRSRVGDTSTVCGQARA